MKKVYVKFANIPAGLWFEDSSGRRMIKMQPTLPSGCPCKYFFERQGDPRGHIPFTAVDDKGIPCRCPDHASFLVELEKLQDSVAEEIIDKILREEQRL